MAERDRIARFFAPLTTGESGSFALTDDAAILTPPAGQQLVITTDSVIEGIHVLSGAAPKQFAQKLMRRNLSDLAAMGATPWRYTLNVHTPSGLADAWFADFAAALSAEQQQFGLVLIGGDSTSGSGVIHTTLTCFGLLDGASLRRNGAANGDDLYVSGTLGDAAYALLQLQQGAPIDSALAARYHCPTPRLALGNMLHSIASSAIDISDGLIADVAQLCDASSCGAIIEMPSLPYSPWLKDTAARAEFALGGGDDYELAFTAPANKRAAIQTLGDALNLPLTCIGTIVAGKGIKIRGSDGTLSPPQVIGWEHN